MHILRYVNPIALRKAKIVCNFGLSECNRVKVNQYISRAFQHLYMVLDFSFLDDVVLLNSNWIKFFNRSPQ